MQDPHPTNLLRRGAAKRPRTRASRVPYGEPGRVIALGASGAPEVRRSLLFALGSEARASLFFLQSETGFSEEELLRCALGLEREGLVSVEGRPDGNTSRRMVALTAQGRASDAAASQEEEEEVVGGGVAPDPPSKTMRRNTDDEPGEGGKR